MKLEYQMRTSGGGDGGKEGLVLMHVGRRVPPNGVTPQWKVFEVEIKAHCFAGLYLG